MKIRWQLIVLLAVLFCLLFTGGMPLASAQSRSQPAEQRTNAYALAVEDGEFIYVVGESVNLAGGAPAGVLNLGGGMLDIWVAKLRRDGTPVFQLIVGGKADDTASAVAVRQGVIYIAGETWSTDFPGAPGNAGENDALALSLSADGGGVLWARRFGGSDQDSGRAIALWENDLYLTGITWSQDLVAGAAKGDADGFLARLDRSGSLQWLTVFGGRGLDAPFGLAPGPGGIWVTGGTASNNLAGTPLGGGDIFALRFDAAGSQQFAGLYGGSGEDVSYAAALSPDGSLYLTGDTQSAALPGARGQFSGETDSFVMRIGADGRLQSTSYLGGAGPDSGMGLAVLPGGDALVTGGTRSSEFAAGAAQPVNALGGQDAFLAQLNPAGDVLSVRLFGGGGDDEARGIGMLSGGLALAGSFSAGALPYLLFVPASEIPQVLLPTAAPPVPTATQAPTATSQPTETLIPTLAEQPTETPVEPGQGAPVETNTPVVAEPTQVENPAQAAPSSTPAQVDTAPTNTPLPAITSTAAAQAKAATVPPSLPSSTPQTPPAQPAPANPAGLLGSLILLAALGMVVYFFVLKKK